MLIEKFEEGAKLSRISAVIFVEREGQKAIVIGKQGAMLKHIGTRARQQIERILGVKVFLELFVKVREGWRDNVRDVDEAIDWRKQLEVAQHAPLRQGRKTRTPQDSGQKAQGPQGESSRIAGARTAFPGGLHARDNPARVIDV